MDQQQLSFALIVTEYVVITLLWALSEVIFGEWRPVTESGKY